jgi:hypothetical protein
VVARAGKSWPREQPRALRRPKLPSRLLFYPIFKVIGELFKLQISRRGRFAFFKFNIALMPV